MKKNTLLLLLLLSCFCQDSIAQLTYVPDDNFEAYLEANSMGNGIANDDYVTTANIENVTTLDLEAQNIGDATGIEGFVSITNLFFDNNQITAIDLSKNTELYRFSISYNSLVTLDFTGNLMLYDIDISNNLLTSINLNNNTALVYLDVTNNLLTSINTSNNTLLYSMGIDNNQLSSIDVSNNTILSGITATNNLLTTIDLTLNTLLFHVDIQNNQLTSVNIQNGVNTNLSTSYQFNTKNNPNLYCILVDNISYSTTNWTNIDAQSYFRIDCVETYVPDDNFENYLETHDANGNTVIIGDTSSMGNGVANDDYVTTTAIESVTTLDINTLDIGDLPGIEDFLALEYFYCNDNGFNDIDVSSNTNLIELHCYNNFIGGTIDISSNTKLEKLIANDCQMTNLILGANNVLTELNIYNSNIPSLDLSTTTAITNLNCSQNYNLNTLDVSVLPLLTDLNCGNINITSLNLSSNTNLVSLTANNLNGFNLDLSSNTLLTTIIVTASDLTSLNVKNGNNTNIVVFEATENVPLTCIQVDDAVYSTANWINIDTQVSFNEDCSETYVPDNNFENYLETHDASGNTVAIGTTTSMGNGIANDNYVFTNAISSVIDLDVNNQSIVDLTGIAGFSAIETLRCYENNITTLNVTQNTALIELRCRENGMTSLDVSQNINLIDLYCQKNSLTSLDITQSTALVNLSFYNNSLTTIDVTQNVLLEQIDCVNNSLASIDVTQNVVLKYFYCDENNLTSLDVTQNILLDEFYCNYNQITSLDVSNCIVLDEFNCSYNNLSSLNIKNGNNIGIGTVEIQGNSNLTCVLVDDVTYSTTNWTDIDVQTNFSETDCYSRLELTAILQGAMLNPNTGEETWMRDDLRIAGLVPIASPYTPDAIQAGVLDITGAKAVVDWVLIELRSATDNTSIITTMDGLLLRDGSIVSTDGVSSVMMFANTGSYYVSIKHRNHLGIMSNSTITISNTGTAVDFTDANNQITYGTDAQTSLGMPTGIVGMWTGDVNGDGILQYTGATPDTPSILSNVLNDVGNFLNLPTYNVTGYNANDVDMNGGAQYTGAAPDSPNLLKNTLSHPGNFLNLSTFSITEQLPE
ncbi:MAG: hypothetical protein HRT69_15500 [Flavobacteriaceae bacterium]|nr:hypothetical protein [Flavobacteriaceae bacterium]